ncbi:MAG: GxxExxY protein [Gemmatimonadota bacterium]
MTLDKNDDRPLTGLTGVIIGCAMTVHRALGPGLLESTYRRCLEYELGVAGLEVRSEVGLPLVYGNVRLEMGYRIDIIVSDLVVLEINSVETILPIHESQLLTYLKLSQKQVGLLLNFNTVKLTDGIKRNILSHNRQSAPIQ